MKSSEGILIIALYVNDFICATNSLKLFQRFKQWLSDEFAIRDLGPLSYCLGIEFSQDLEKETIGIKQVKFIGDLLFKRQDAKEAYTPLEPRANLEDSAKTPQVNRNMWQQLIGSLLYISTGSRPDISYAINYLSSFNHDPKVIHWKAAERVLRYLSATREHSLVYWKDS